MSSEEAQMMERLQSGRATDRDINYIMERGDRSQKRVLVDMENRQRKEMEHKGRIYGDDIEVFDGIDKQGNFYKDIPLSDLIS